MGMVQFLKISFVLLGILLLPVLCVDSKLEGKDALDHKSPLLASPNSSENGNGKKVDPTYITPLKKEKKEEDPNEVTQSNVLINNVSNRKDKTEKISEDSSKVGGSKEGIESKQGKNMGKENSISGNLNDGLDSKLLKTKNGDKESSRRMKVKENSRDEECDPSNMCVDEKNNLTACLKVPGNDLPDLSLQIWNKGTNPVSISITAPAFVKLEETKVQLQPNEDKKVKVSISDKGTDTLIFLTTKNSNCTLDFKELIPHDPTTETRNSFKLKKWTRTHFIVVFLAVSSVLVFGCAWMYFGLHKKLILRRGYRAVEMDLPVVSAVAKNASGETSGGWDDSWDDNWGDEEAAPITPRLPVTPNLSGKGLASRRLLKEAWKD